jgi:hypothetical protein
VVLPFAIHGIPDNLEVVVDAASVRIQGPDGRVWKKDLAGMTPRKNEPGRPGFSCYLFIDRDFYNHEGWLPVNVRVKAYFTLLGDPRSTTIPVQSKRSTAQGLRCGIGLLDEVYCASAFRWPGKGVYGTFEGRGAEPFTTQFSYSPFPGEMTFHLIETHWVSTPISASEVTITTREPVSHFDREFEIQDVRLYVPPPGKPKAK